MKPVKRSGVSIAVAAAALIAAIPAQSGPAYADDAKGRCMGANACKGQSACSANGCSGTNACKGKGLEIETDRCAEYLERLDFSVARDGDEIDATVPFHRHYDVTREPD
ncbi:MAG TPA: hypothetical protein VK193_07405, partial [Methyloceanibacter sp.]|nr:hypothetical protein [Methyloceanibacter sp.]